MEKDKNQISFFISIITPIVSVRILIFYIINLFERPNIAMDGEMSRHF